MLRSIGNPVENIIHKYNYWIVKRRFDIWLLAFVIVMLTGCYDHDHEEVVVSGAPVRVDLAFTLSGSSSNKTRMADAVVQINSARTYDILSIIPMINETPDIQTFSNETVVDKPSSTNPTAKFYHYGSCDMSPGVNKCIVYAKAQADDPVDSKAHNGSLTVSYNNTPSASFPAITAETDMSKISFSPVSMLANEDIGDNPGSNPETPSDYDDAWALANYLTAIANASVEVSGNTYYWRTYYDNPTLKILFQNFTNNVNKASTGQVLAGSATNVKKWASLLKSALENQSFDEGSVAKKLKDRILTLIGDPSSITSTYPRNYDLPDGAAVLQWVETTNGNTTTGSFVPQTQTTTLANINSISRYVYPPELYYFVNSDVRCKESQVDYQSLYGTNTTWAGFLSAAEFVNADPDDDITTVTGTTKAVALKDPVQYAVAHLQVIAQAAGSFTDVNGQDVTMDNNFPLTGVIVGGQRAVDYQFEPTTTSDENVKFVYDSEVNEYDDEHDTYVHYLTTSFQEMANTLVLQTNDEENMTIILEFENKSGSQFYGVNNEIIYPDTRFYLVGTIPYNAGTGGDAISAGRVFTKAYTTEVKLTVNSLAGAYNVLPNILSSHLVVGVEVMTNWIAAEPTTVVLQ